VQAINSFDLADLNLTKEDFITKDQVVQIGVSPNRLDLMTFLSGVSFDEAWETREYGNLDGLSVPFISKALLRRNKLSCGRLQDLADAERL